MATRRFGTTVALAALGGLFLVFGLRGQLVETGSDPAAFAVRAFEAIGAPDASAALRSAETASSAHSQGFAGRSGGLFPIASVTKPITAVAVLQLVDRGAIDLDDPVSELLPAVPSEAAAGSITVRQLLAHTSGISTRAGLVYTSDDVRTGEAFSAVTRRGTAGAEHEYSNLNYRILGVIVEETTGRTLSDYLRAEILTPAGMGRTVPYGAGVYPVPGYTQVFGLPVRYFWESGMDELASGGLLSTEDDMLAFADALLAAYDGDRAPLDVDRRLIEEMWSTQIEVSEAESAGLGWQINDVAGVSVISHGGDLPGYQTTFTIVPAEQRVMVIFANANTLALAVAGEIIQQSVRSWMALGRPSAPSVRLPRVGLAVVGVLLLLLALLMRSVMRFIAQVRGTPTPRRVTSQAISIFVALFPALFVGFLAVRGLLDDAFVMLPDVIGVVLLIALVGIARAAAIVAHARRRSVTNNAYSA